MVVDATFPKSILHQRAGATRAPEHAHTQTDGQTHRDRHTHTQRLGSEDMGGSRHRVPTHFVSGNAGGVQGTKEGPGSKSPERGGGEEHQGSNGLRAQGQDTRQEPTGSARVHGWGYTNQCGNREGRTY